MTASDQPAARWVVSGFVQGVGFRFFVAREAARAGVVGWVRNLPDGRVEAVARGTSEALAEFENALRRGPRMASVENVEKLQIPPESVRGNAFEIK